MESKARQIAEGEGGGGKGEGGEGGKAVRRCGLPFVRRIETKSASGETSAALYATHSTKITHMPSHLTLPRICTPVTGVRVIGWGTYDR